MALPVYQYWTRQPVAVEGLAINLIADYDMQLKVNEVSSSSALDSLIFWTQLRSIIRYNNNNNNNMETLSRQAI
jgi:hypothetical protein